MTGAPDIDRRSLRRALLEAEPWLAETDVGPASVDAGACERCGEVPRLLPTCGPAGYEALCRDCGLEVGEEGWCDGHAAEGLAARCWAAALPASWAQTVTLWWYATGELRSLDLLTEPWIPSGSELVPPWALPSSHGSR
jgi:hypothetical protein